MLVFTFVILIAIQILSVNGIPADRNLEESSANDLLNEKLDNENDPNVSKSGKSEAIPKNRSKTEQFYTVNITRDSLKTYTNNLIESLDVSTKDSYLTFSEKMDDNNALIILKANISIRGIQIWSSKTKNAMKNICDNSYPAGSVEENVSKIVSETVLGYLECPVEKGMYRTLPYKLDQQTLRFNKPIPCGDYLMDVTLDTSDLKRVFDFTFNWTIPLDMNCKKDPFIIA